MTEYLIVFKGDDFDPIHAMSFDAAVERVEECLEAKAEIHYALEVETLPMWSRRVGFDRTEKFTGELNRRYDARQIELGKAYVDTGAGDERRKVLAD